MYRIRPILLVGLLALFGAACAGADESPAPGATPGGQQPSPVQTQPAVSPDQTQPAASPDQSPAGTPAGSPAVSPGASPTGESITITGVDYAFEGVPTSVPAGTTFAFDNQGTELHEMAILRKNDDVTLSFEEILQLPDDEALAMITPVGQAFALPGEPAEGEVTLEQEGEYIMLCFIPQGTFELPGALPGASPGASPSPSPASSPATGSPAASPAVGPPHFVLGMAQLFDVTEPGSTPGPIASPMPPVTGSPAPGASPQMSPAASPSP